MIQDVSFFPVPKSFAVTNLPPESVWNIILRSGLTEIAWRKAVITEDPTASEIEHQKMAFLQKLIEVVRKSSIGKSAIRSDDDSQNTQGSTKITPNSFE